MKIKMIRKVARLALKYLTEDPSVGRDIQQQAGRLVAELSSLDDQIDENADSIERLEERNAALEAKNQQLEERVASLEATLADIKTAVDGLPEQLERVRETIEGFEIEPVEPVVEEQTGGEG